MPTYGHTLHTQPQPDMALEAHPYRPTHVRGTTVFPMPNSENHVNFHASGMKEADEAHSLMLFQGTPASSPLPRAQVFVKPTSHSLNVPPRVSDVSDSGRILCPHDGCESWFGSHNPHKLAKHITKKHGGA
jgi:hypothetical protein